MEPLTIGSLFSGIGGLDLGIERGLASAGVAAETIWQVEESDFCRRILSRHWPNAERYTDVRTVTESSVRPVDILVGGFPCQDISTAGKGAGLAGEKSGLFFEMARIVGEIRPRIVCFENVPAITSRGLDTVLGTMASLGYDARWGGLRASEVGAPHRRERWFCVCWLADGCKVGRSRQLVDPEQGGLAVSSGAMEKKKNQRRAKRPISPDYSCPVQSTASRCDEASRRPLKSGARSTRKLLSERGAATQPGLDGEIDGIPARLDIPRRWPAPPGPQHDWEPPRLHQSPSGRYQKDERLSALGNAVVPACAEIIGRFIGSELVTLPVR